MDKKKVKAENDQRIAHVARKWRDVDKEAIANKSDPEKQRAEYFQRKELRKTIDAAGQP